MTVPEGLDGEIDAHIAALEQRTAKGFGDAANPLLVSVRSGRRDLDARDDGHDPQPRSERRRGRGPGGVHGQRALRAGLVPAADPDVRRGRRRRRRPSLRAGAHRPEGLRAASPRTSSSPPTISASSSRRSARSTKRRRGTRSRRIRATSCAARIAPSSTRGTRRARRCTGPPTTSRTTSAPP